jgi:hypothetical protein
LAEIGNPTIMYFIFCVLLFADKETGLVKQGGSVYEPGPDEDLTKEGGERKVLRLFAFLVFAP